MSFFRWPQNRCRSRTSFQCGKIRDTIAWWRFGLQIWLLIFYVGLCLFVSSWSLHNCKYFFSNQCRCSTDHSSFFTFSTFHVILIFSSSSYLIIFVLSYLLIFVLSFSLHYLFIWSFLFLFLFLPYLYYISYLFILSFVSGARTLSSPSISLSFTQVLIISPYRYIITKAWLRNI